MAGVLKSALVVLGFIVSMYFIHDSVSSLNKINLLTGQHKTEVLEQQIRYKRALTEDEAQYGSLAPPKPVPIIKCCNKWDFLTTDLSCISRNVSGRDTYDFFPKGFIVDSNFLQTSVDVINVVYGTNLCRDEVLVVNEEDLQEHVITESGDLLRLTNSGLVYFNYSTNYCVDRISDNSYMILKCPCRNHFCIQKCCAHNQYYHTNSQQCRKLGHLPEIEMDLNKLMTINSTREPYLLYRPLNCSKLVNISGSILLEENYTLAHGAGNVAINPGNYCIDASSDGRNNTNFNAFYCPNIKQKRQTSMNINKCCRKGESLNQYYQCRFKVSNTVPWTPNDTLLGHTFQSFAFKNFKIPDNSIAIHLKKKDYVLYIRSKSEQKLYMEDIIKRYPADQFCVDEYQEDGEFALIFSPCQHIMCLQKCCGYGTIFNLTSYKCEESAHKSNAISLITTNELHEVEEYFLVTVEPKCHFYKLIHPNLMGAERIFLQPNGDISKRIERTKIRWVSPAKYCIDTFLQGSISMSNGFFCFQSKQSKRDLNLPEVPLNNGKIRHYITSNVLLVSCLIFLFFACLLDASN